MKKLNITLLKARNALFITAVTLLALFSSPSFAQVFLTDGDGDGFTPLEGDCDDSDNLVFPGAGGCRDADPLDATALDTSYSTDGVDFFSIPASLDIYSIQPRSDQSFFAGESNGEPLLFKISETLSPTSGSYYNTSDIFTDTSAPANSRYLSSLSFALFYDYACYGTTGSETYGVVALDPSVPEHVSSFGSSGIATQSLALGLFTENCILLSDGTDLFVFASGCTGDESTCTTDVTKRDSFTGSIEGSFASSGTYAGLNNKKLIHAVNSFSGSEFFQLYADATTDALSLIDSTGVLVTSFGTDGYADLPVALESGQILVSDDEIYIAGTSGDNSTIHIFKMDDTGTLDATFGTAGQLDIVISSEVTEPLSILNVLIYSYTLDNVDQFLIGGSLGDDAFIATLDTVNETLYSGHGGSGDGLFILNLGADEFSSSVFFDNHRHALIGVSNQSGTSEVYAAKYRFSVCGDGVLDINEESCDDGNTVALDGCSDGCTVETTYYTDADGDNYGDALATAQYFSSVPSGFSSNNRDCDDTDDTIHPSQFDLCDGIDNDCTGFIDDDQLILDDDSDNHYALSSGSVGVALSSCLEGTHNIIFSTVGQFDCNDNNNTANQDAEEICDNIDNDCDSSIDEGFSPNIYFRDVDGDNFGDGTDSVTLSCLETTAPTGYVDSPTDCDDTTPLANPTATEVCDNIDNDCDTLIDDGFSPNIYFRDVDGDTFGDVTDSVTLSCLETTAPTGYVDSPTDCDDTTILANPTATEACDGIDNDCDSTVDESGATGETTFYQDSDGDTFGDASSTQTACSAPTGFVSDDTDCDDAESAINPDATEECDEIDNDCDASIDEAGAEGEETFYEDSDADTFGNAISSVSACEVPSGYVSDDTDCDDDSSDIHSSADEICGDGIDQDCDGEDLTCSTGGGIPPVSAGGCQMSQENQNPQSFAFSGLLLIGGLTLVRKRLTA